MEISRRVWFPAKAVGLTLATLLTSCSTTAPEIRAPSLTYEAFDNCSPRIDFTAPIKRASDKKSMKRQMKTRVIEMTADMESQTTPCLQMVEGGKVPYQLFEIPTGMSGRVVSAGSKLDTEVIFAGDIETFDINGNQVRRFSDSEYRRFGSLYGVQFSPAEDEVYILIIANPDLVGEKDETVETAVSLQQVYMTVGAVTGSGTNTIGTQRRYDRTYSYNGDVTIRTVFPKQEDK